MKRIKLSKIPRLKEREWWRNGVDGLWQFSEVDSFLRAIKLAKQSVTTMPFRVLYDEPYCEYPHVTTNQSLIEI